MPTPCPMPEWLDPAPWLALARGADPRAAHEALASGAGAVEQFAALLSPAAGAFLEDMARRAQELTRRHFGRTISLYVPLYLSDYCGGGCAYCGFAADRRRPRRRLAVEDILAETEVLASMGFEEILLLTGERTEEADFSYLLQAVRLAADRFHLVAVETFSMTEGEYRALAQAGCTGVTLYQETYDPAVYERMHRWGPKRDYALRLESPERALAAGLRTAGLGVLLGLADPIFDAIALYRHLERLRKHYWRAGLAVSFPRVRPEPGGFRPSFPISERFLAQMIFAFRICLPDVPLVLSTRENAAFRDGIAGLGVNKMSIASKTAVGGYHGDSLPMDGQFLVSDDRDVASFCEALRRKGLDPVFKNWESVYRPG